MRNCGESATTMELPAIFYKLCYFSYLMEYSCLKTLASKHKCTIAKVVEKFKDHYGE